MKLKGYQDKVLRDLEEFIDRLSQTNNISKSYKEFWENRGVKIGDEGMPPYNNDIPGIPHVCFKVPTGGGKTFIAANAVKPIIDYTTDVGAKAVVWLVPSDTILNQTISNLSNVNHPLRQKLDVDFGGRTEIYSKQQLLTGQNFNPTSVMEQLSVFVLTFDSFRSSIKEGRKAYQQNGHLVSFEKMVKDSAFKLEEIDETALIQVIRSLNPVVIVDESHRATSPLSNDMLITFNPSFVLDLTATPKQGSNIISFVDALQLKKENMVKLPVIVYNRKSQEDVYNDAITLRRKLEARAKQEESECGIYIRPIVLFQAQPKTSDDSTTFDKIKKTLIELGIKESHIAIKIGGKDEIKSVNLMSRDCHIRYIITVDALKEGWDCPFAYILATVANRTSVLDVEQILGRVLRQPYATKHKSGVLNLSYVLTSSVDFNSTLEKVVVGLNNAGFSQKDYRAKDVIVEEEKAEQNDDFVQINVDNVEEPNADIPEIDTSAIRERLEVSAQIINTDTNEGVSDDLIVEDELLSIAVEQNNEYESALEEVEETEISRAPLEIRDKMNEFCIRDELKEEISDIKIPQFVIETELNFFTDSEKLLTLSDLDKGFTLKGKSAEVDFTSTDTEMARIDVEESEDSSVKAYKVNGSSSAYFKEWFNSRPSETRLNICKDVIKKQLSKIDGVNDAELSEYINRVVELMSEDQISEMQQSPFPYIERIKKKIDDLLEAHRSDVFSLWLEQDKIKCKEYYSFKKSISPVTATDVYPRSLYKSEDGNMNDYEKSVVFEISSLENVKWWHRNISKLGFQINGYVHAYPDLVVMTKSGKVLMVETKGDNLDNPASRTKAKIGAKWAELAGVNYKYYMVFQKTQPEYGYSFERFMKIIREL